MMKHTFDNITFLDCTLRDGGYYTNWQFDSQLVCKYIALCDQVGIDIVELGYLSLKKKMVGSYGDLPFYVPQSVVEQILSSSHLRFAVMIDMKDMTAYTKQAASAEIKNRLSHSSIPISLLRFAVHFSQIDTTINYLQDIQESDYEICVNLMQIDLASHAQIEYCIAILSKLQNLSVVYLADSLGTMNPEAVKILINRFASQLDCSIGFHAHDNRGLALHNSLIAASEGATWIDSTFYGMGRGSGNAKTEQLLPFFRPTISLHKQYELHRFIATYFHPIKERYDWGSNIFYSIAGISQIHPTYIQQLEAKKSATIEEKLHILSFLENMKASTFSDQLLEEALENAQ